MTIQEQIHESMSRWLSKRLEKDVTVTSYDESIPKGYWGCDTCGDDSVDVTVYYREVDSSDDKVYIYFGSLAELIVNLT